MKSCCPFAGTNHKDNKRIGVDKIIRISVFYQFGDTVFAAIIHFQNVLAGSEGARFQKQGGNCLKFLREHNAPKQVGDDDGDTTRSSFVQSGRERFIKRIGIHGHLQGSTLLKLKGKVMRLDKSLSQSMSRCLHGAGHAGLPDALLHQIGSPAGYHIAG